MSTANDPKPPPWADRSWPADIQVAANLLVGVACLFVLAFNHVPIVVAIPLIAIAAAAILAVLFEGLVAKLKQPEDKG